MAKGNMNYTPLVPLTKKDVVNGLTSNTTNLPGSAANDKALKQQVDQQKVDLENKINAAKYTHPATHPATMIAQDSTHRFVTDTWLQAQTDQYNNIINQLNVIKTSINSLPSKSDVSAVTTAVNNNTNTRKNELATTISNVDNNVLNIKNNGMPVVKQTIKGMYTPNSNVYGTVQITIPSVNPNKTIIQNISYIDSDYLLNNNGNGILNASIGGYIKSNTDAVLFLPKRNSNTPYPIEGTYYYTIIEFY